MPVPFDYSLFSADDHKLLKNSIHLSPLPGMHVSGVLNFVCYRTVKITVNRSVSIYSNTCIRMVATRYILVRWRMVLLCQILETADSVSYESNIFLKIQKSTHLTSLKRLLPALRDCCPPRLLPSETAALRDWLS